MGTALVVDLGIACTLILAGSVIVWRFARQLRTTYRLVRVAGVALGILLGLVGVGGVLGAIHANRESEEVPSVREPQTDAGESAADCEEIEALANRLADEAKAEAAKTAGLSMHETESFFVGLRVIVNSPKCFDPELVARAQEVLAEHDQPEVDVDPPETDLDRIDP